MLQPGAFPFETFSNIMKWELPGINKEVSGTYIKTKTKPIRNGLFLVDIFVFSSPVSADFSRILEKEILNKIRLSGGA